MWFPPFPPSFYTKPKYICNYLYCTKWNFQILWITDQNYFKVWIDSKKYYLCAKKPLHSSSWNDLIGKVNVFWEGHKIWKKNLPLVLAFTYFKYLATFSENLNFKHLGGDIANLIRLLVGFRFSQCKKLNRKFECSALDFHWWHQMA